MLNTHVPYGPYEVYFKRPLDFVCGIAALMLFWWLYIIIALLVKVKLGSPVLFVQRRPGKNEKLFKLYKFRTMTNKTDEKGNLLPDDKRLTKFGKWLRSTSLDELPEAFNLINGTLSVCGPRPLLVKDMVFMSNEQRTRHMVMPGLSGLAQINGRNAINWEDKFEWDLKYIQRISLKGDLKIILQTVYKAFFKREGIAADEKRAISVDFGDYLLLVGKVTKAEYDKKIKKAEKLLKNR